ncbi:MAG: L-histidine N(alpha)-methyltransferase, partial [Planctomycetota bacterium]
PGAGSGEKAVMLIDSLDDPVGVVPVDISMDYVERSAEALARRFPNLEILPLCADFTEPLDIPPTARAPSSRLVFFPGSTVGNFHRPEREQLIKNFAAAAGPGGRALLGVDLVKDGATLEAAYDDSDRITEAFNLNLLARMNRELGSDFEPDDFHYVAEWDTTDSAVHMYLESRVDQTVSISDTEVTLTSGERIHTESSYKFTPESFAAEAARCGLEREAIWTDERGWFSVVLLKSTA